VFTFVGQIEFFYDQSPNAMRSMGSALSLTTNVLGNYLSTLLVVIVTAFSTRNGALGWIPDNLNRGYLDYFFWVLAVLSTVNFVVYLWIASTRQQHQLTMLSSATIRALHYLRTAEFQFFCN
jgi:peptide/histidine transporter 3/4